MAMIPEKQNISRLFSRITRYFTPKIIAEVNDVYVKLAKVKGQDVPWHTHDDEDELFWVLEGELEVMTRDSTVIVRPGEFTVVPHGVEHRVVPRGHVKLVLFEPAGIAHTGNVKAEITLDRHEYLGDS